MGTKNKGGSSDVVVWHHVTLQRFLDIQEVMQILRVVVSFGKNGCIS